MYKDTFFLCGITPSKLLKCKCKTNSKACKDGKCEFEVYDDPRQMKSHNMKYFCIFAAESYEKCIKTT